MPKDNMDAAMVARLRRSLLSFYDKEARDLPWRHTRDPYSIWVSEIMLQQTQVDTVRPRYLEFLRQFPDISVLAAATAEKVCEAWAGLGYYRRARNLHLAAQHLVKEHNGCLPRDTQSLQELPGIGRYTAGAIASIAFGQPAPVVDGNVVRVLSRIWAIDNPPSSTAGKKQLWSLATALALGDNPGELNQAVMELGALVCTPTRPKCEDCPARTQCRAQGIGTPEAFPIIESPRPRRKLNVAFGWTQTRRGVWLVQRPVDGLWAGLWELPSAEGPHARRDLARRLSATVGKCITVISHQLTHRDVTAKVYALPQLPRLRAGPGVARYADPLQAPLSGLAKKAIQATLTKLSKP